MMNNRIFQFRKFFVVPTAALCACLGSTTLLAQDETEDDVFELSPFEVEASNGYVQTRTLAGTRLNTELANVPQQISILTEQFLEDIAATTPEDAMLYSLNVENLVEFSEGGSNSNYNRGINFNDFGGRMRGIAQSGRMRDFFDTNLQGDTYNLDQLTISSGPNAVIYGLGGTGGVINASFKKALFGNNFTSLETRVDSEESLRFTLDWNYELSDDRLAVRFIALKDDFETYRNGSDGEQRRWFLTASFRPWKGANLRAYYEDVDIKKALPRNVVAFDGGYTAYMDYVAAGGDPYYDNNAENPAPIAGTPWEGIIERSGQNRHLWVLQGSGTPIDLGRTDGTFGYWARTIDPSRQAADPSDRLFRWSLPEDSPIVSLEHNVHGLTSGRHMYGEIYGLVFNQQITKDLHVEIGLNKESGFTDFWNMAQPGAAVVRVDPNMYLPDGVTPNPWKGMPFVEHWGQSTTDYNDMYGLRMTVSYNLDLTELSKWLGRHQFMGLVTKDRYDRFWSFIRTRHIPADEIGDYDYDSRIQRRHGQTWYRWYLDPKTFDMVNPFDPLNGGYQPDGSYVFALSNSPGTGFTWSSLAERKGATGAVQSFWLDERLVTTLGYRQGWFTNGQASPKWYQDLENDIFWAMQNIEDVDRELDKWGEETKEDAINYGAVLHLTKNDSKFGQWSIFYNWADIFNSPSPSVFADGSPIPAAVGESYDYGVIWSGPENKIGFRLNWYKTISDNTNNCGWCGSIRNPVHNIERLIGAPGRESFNLVSYADDLGSSEIEFVDVAGNPVTSPPVPFDPDSFKLDRELSHWHMVANRQSKGVEIEAWANPTNNWSFRLTAAENEATDVDGLRGWGDWIDKRYSYYKAWAEWEQNTYRVGNENSLAVSGGSVTNQFNGMAPAYTTLKNSDGVKVNQNVGWRINFTGRYNFSEGKLKGAHLGAHLRYREAPVIGYITLPADNPFSDFPGTPTNFTTPSLDNPVEGPDRTDFDMFMGYNGKLFDDKIRYTVRLNIRNVFDDTDMVPQKARSDGSIAIYTYKPPRTFILSVELKY